jgi:hypothetical protein
MTAARRRALLLILAAVAIIGALALFAARPSAPPAPAKKPRLLLLTSLPLVFGEGFGLEGGGSPTLKYLSQRYTVLPISTTAPAELRKGSLLMMAQPPAQTAENLVALDAWAHAGGRVLLLADPLLEWPSERQLGDPLRPPAMFMDTGLLNHWNLQLLVPDRRGLVMLGGGHGPVAFVSPGRLVTKDRSCALSRVDIVAQCKIGKGRAVVVADADLLDPAIAELRDPPINNMHELEDYLDSLER